MLSGEYSYYLNDPVFGTDRSGHFQASICSAIRLPPPPSLDFFPLDLVVKYVA